MITRQEIRSDFITAKELWDRREGLLKGFEKFEPDMFIGMEGLDRILRLRFGQFVVLQGDPSHDLSLLLCVKATMPEPLGTDSDVLCVDGGNIFDAYLISKYSIEQELDSEKVLERIHLSRAFTYHQLTSLLTEKLPSAMDAYGAKLVIVSDMIQLYCDPDIRGADKLDALRIFANTVRFLRTIAEQKHALILATSLQAINQRMNRILLCSAHLSAKLEDRGTFTELNVIRHPSLPHMKASVPKPGVQSLERYL
jgi:hypothetical protein